MLIGCWHARARTHARAAGSVREVGTRSALVHEALFFRRVLLEAPGSSCNHDRVSAGVHERCTRRSSDCYRYAHDLHRACARCFRPCSYATSSYAHYCDVCRSTCFSKIFSRRPPCSGPCRSMHARTRMCLCSPSEHSMISWAVRYEHKCKCFLQTRA